MKQIKLIGGSYDGKEIEILETCNAVIFAPWVSKDDFPRTEYFEQNDWVILVYFIYGPGPETPMTHYVRCYDERHFMEFELAKQITKKGEASYGT